MKQYYGYVRVSTVKQGEHGVSLEQQREAIERYARKNGFPLVRWFEEQETAAKRGRPIFSQMLSLLRAGAASGLIIHKIDRSARNLKDWADMGELIDSGMEVHFANESLDLNSRGGRLSADIQAVVAADYIRNLREETKKGFYGRLKQGYYPRPAPIGYRDVGSAQPKAIDPIQGPLVQQAFELYASGLYNLERLVEHMYTLGLRSKSGRRVAKSAMARMLRNGFYTGLIAVRKTGQTYEGKHGPLVTVARFKQVQEILSGKVCRRTKKYAHLFRQLCRCVHCGRCLIGEAHKGHVYYRCHAKGCPSRSVREERIDRELLHQFLQLEYSQDEKDHARAKILEIRQNWEGQRDGAIAALKLNLAALDDRQNRLTDAYVDGAIERSAFEQRKTALFEERRSVQSQIEGLNAPGSSIADRLTEVVELAGSAYLAYQLGVDEEKRDLVKKLSSNRLLDGNSLIVKLETPFQLIANRFSVPCGRPSRTTGRDVEVIWKDLLPKLVALLDQHIEAQSQGCS